MHVQLLAAWSEIRAMTGNGKTSEEVQSLLTRVLGALDGAARSNVEAKADAAAADLPVQLAALDKGVIGQPIIEMLAAMDDLATAAEAEIVAAGVVERVAEAEAESGLTARTKAAAKELGAAGVESFQTLVHGLGVRATLEPPPTIIRFLEDTFIDEEQLREDAQRHKEGYIRLFARIAGDRSFMEYKRRDIIQWVRTLEKVKRTIGRSDKDPHKTIAQIVRESRGQPTLGVTTIEKHITHVKGFFLAAHKHYKWCPREDVEDMFDKVRLSGDVPGKQDRKLWTIAQLNALLASPIWTGTRSRADERTKRHQPGPWIYRDAYWWLPVVALFSAARLEELAQLHHDDLKHDQDGVPFLIVKETKRQRRTTETKQMVREDAQRLKNKHSFRDVPVHPFLVSLGFLELFDPSKGGRRIWPELVKHGRPPSWGGLYSSHFTDYRKASDLYEELRDFHSFRHNCITALRTRAKIDPLTVAAIAGHTTPDPRLKEAMQTDDYTHYSVAAKGEALKQIDYAAYGVDLSILSTTAAACGPRGSCRAADLPQKHADNCLLVAPNVQRPGLSTPGPRQQGRARRVR
jgi:integrase